MAIRDDIKDQVQHASDIVRLIGEQVALKPKGREFVGLCPFHDDKRPSMQVSPAKQIYKCFSCGAGGDVFSFVMGYHKMTFPEALAHLAQRAGIELQRSDAASPRSNQNASDRKRMTLANQRALTFYQAMLKHPEQGRLARETFDRRGISPDMVAAFRLGYAPDGWDGLVQAIGAKRWDHQAFELASLIKARKSGSGCFDFLRHRLVFPILDALGRPIAFGGRKLREEDEPKYLNTPETSLFNKSRTLYGLHLAKKPIIDTKTAVIVEGYTDVIACHQAGFGNVVATLGTALTAQHVAELRRYAQKVVLIFDADEAGEKAAQRAVELFLTGDLDVAIAELPKGPNDGKVDPAELMAMEDGPALWRTAIDAAVDALAYQFEQVRRRVSTADTVAGQQQAAQSYLDQVARLGVGQNDPIRRALIVQQLASLLRMGEREVDALLRKAAAKHSRPKPNPRLPAGADASGDFPKTEDDVLPPEVEIPFQQAENIPWEQDASRLDGGHAAGLTPSKRKALELAERQLIGCLLKDNDLFVQPLPEGRSMDEAIAPSDFAGRQTYQLYEQIHERLVEGQDADLAGLLGDLAVNHQQALSDLATQAAMEVERMTGGERERIVELFAAAAQAVLSHHRERMYQDVRRTFKEDDADRASLLRHMMEQRRLNPSPVRIARQR